MIHCLNMLYKEARYLVVTPFQHNQIFNSVLFDGTTVIDDTQHDHSSKCLVVQPTPTSDKAKKTWIYTPTHPNDFLA
jgi:hypothetical protein